jgi:hypothetical protein
MPLGYNKPLYILPFDHRATFQTGMFGWKGPISQEQTARIAAAKEVIYDALPTRLGRSTPSSCHISPGVDGVASLTPCRLLHTISQRLAPKKCWRSSVVTLLARAPWWSW